MHKAILLSLHAMLIGVSTLTVLHAAEIPDRGPMPFEVFDADADGFITEQEFQQAHAARQAQREAQGRRTPEPPTVQLFQEFDSDGNGVLSPAELAAGQQARQQNRRGMQQPGRPSGAYPGSVRAHNMPKFADFDLDQDGQLTEDEFLEGRSRRISERAQQGYKLRGLQHAKPFAEIDADGDGLVSPQEFVDAQLLHQQQRQQWQGQ